MKNIVPMLCALFCIITICLAVVPQTRAYTLETAYIIGIHTDGTASWTIEQSAYIETETDETNFSNLIYRATSYIDQFTSNVSAIIDQAHDKTGRFMTYANISISGNVSGLGAYAFLDYMFDWTNFATVSNTNITLGDAFSNDSFMLGDGSLSIILPTGYTVESCSPPPDSYSNGVLTWNSINSLQNGQPTIQLSTMPPPTIAILSPNNMTYSVNHVPLSFTTSENTTEWYSLDGANNVTIMGNITLTNLSNGSHTVTIYVNNTSGSVGSSPTVYFVVNVAEGAIFTPTSLLLLEIMIPLASAVLASALFLKFRKKKENPNGTVPNLAAKEAGDTEKILALLKREGGQMLQSEITDRLRFSKAKTSRILGDMEKNGFIMRHKSGRDKVVHIQNNAEKNDRQD